MSKMTNHVKKQCAICQQWLPISELVPGRFVRSIIADRILSEHPNWNSENYICNSDLNRYRSIYVQGVLEKERGELSSLEQEVLQSLRDHEVLADNLNETIDEQSTYGQRLADRVASFGGSWTFLILFAAILILWIGMNSVAIFAKPFDPYPYILLNLVLSCLAAIQAPVIMMSQNRQEAKDRLRAENDYRVNLKAELEIRHLHSKLDLLLTHQWQRLLEIQQVQMDLLQELGKKR